MQLNRFPAYYDPSSLRVIYTATPQAKEYLFYLQETGYLKLRQSHPGTQRRNLDSFLLALVAEGRGELTYQGQRYALAAGQGFFVDCTRPHSYESSREEPWALYWVHFNGHSARWMYSQFEAEGGPVFPAPDPEQWRAEYEKLIDTARRSEHGSEVAISCQITGLLTGLLTRSDRAAEDKLSAVHEYIGEHFARPLTLDELSERFYISKFHLARSFKERYGLTLLEHQTHLRINYAKQLLRYSGLTLEEIGRSCGYESQSYFSRMFRRTEGMTALAYRKSWQSKGAAGTAEG